MKNFAASIFSINDILEAYKNYDASEEAKEPILYFVSELTGMSVDAIVNKVEKGGF